MQILQIVDINDVDFTVTFSMYLFVKWMEARLQKNGTTPGPDNQETPVDLKFLDKLWVPDVYFYDLKKLEDHMFLTKFAGEKTYSYLLNFNYYVSGLFVINGNEILYTQELLITFWCRMRFENYPLDTQSCNFRVRLHTSHHLTMMTCSTIYWVSQKKWYLVEKWP